MSSLVVLCEGPTEQAFVTQVLEPFLNRGGSLRVEGRLLGKKKDYKGGGISKWSKARRDFLNCLKEKQGHACTCMVDLYDLPDDWPGYSTGNPSDGAIRASALEKAIIADLSDELGDSFDPARIVPYVQVHEFEALLFSDPTTMAESLGKPELEAQFTRIVADCRTAEQIDDGPATAPSKRILKLVQNYEKVVDGARITKYIGMENLREKCPHFADWIGRLDAILLSR